MPPTTRLVSKSEAMLRSRHRRSSTGSGTADAIIHTAKAVEAKVERALLLIWEDLPDWRRDNAFLLSGYRPDSNSYWKSFTSLSYLHNESVNIWSHLLGAFGFLGGGTFLYSVVAPRYASASRSDVVAFACFFAGSVACLGMSATYHAISNHSPEVSKWGNKLDYSGIVFMIAGSFVPVLYYGFFCFHDLMVVYLCMVRSEVPIFPHRSLQTRQKHPSEFLTGDRSHCSAWVVGWCHG
jgi:adiponectin receptor